MVVVKSLLNQSGLWVHVHSTCQIAKLYATVHTSLDIIDNFALSYSRTFCDVATYSNNSGRSNVCTPASVQRSFSQIQQDTVTPDYQILTL